MSRRTERNVGVIGLGIIGSRVAQNLRRRGFHVFVWNRTPRPFPNFVGSRAEVADLCDLIQIFVSDDDALLETVETMKRSLKAHHVVMAHSTVAPHTMRAAAEIVQRRGARFLDAPFTGSKIPAEKGELVYYVAGDETALRRARPVLEASSKEIVEIGEVGQATTVKIATNMITATTIQAAAEALAVVHSAGISPEKFAAAMRGNASQSPTLAMKLPKMMEGDFEPHFSVKHMLKDVQIASRLGGSYGLDLGATNTARNSLRTEAEGGRGDFDFCSLVRVFFPEGSPMQAAREAAAAAAEEQQTLGGLDDAPAAEQKNGAHESTAQTTDRMIESSKAEERSVEVPAKDAEPAAGETPAKAVADKNDDAKPPVEQQEVAGDEPESAPVEAETGNVSEEQVKLPHEAEERVEAKSDFTLAPEPKDGGDKRSDDLPADDLAAETGSAEALKPATVESSREEPKAAENNGEEEQRRGLFSRMFGRAGDN